MNDQSDSDLLYGVPAIAAHLGIREAQCRNRIQSKKIPTFKIGGTICARKTSLAKWLADIEASNNDE